MQPFPAAFFARVSDKMVTVTPIHLFCALCVALLIVISFFYNKLGFDGFLYPAFSGSCAGSIFLYGPDEIHVGKNSWHGCKGVLKLVELVHAHGRQTGVGQRGAEDCVRAACGRCPWLFGNHRPCSSIPSRKRSRCISGKW